ncbi:MAG: PH domain-containing protein [Polyangiaceae bacterium]
MAQQVFEVSSSAGGTWLAAFLLLPATLLLVAAVVFWPRPLRIEVSREAVQIRGSIYGRTIAKRDLDLDRARVVDLNSEPGLSPQLRTNGIGLANYRVGWFRLRNRERALCFLTGDGSVLYLPTRQHYALLVSTSDPGALLAALKGAD